MAQDAAHTTHYTEHTYRRTGTKRPRTPHAQHNAPSEHNGEEEPSGQGHRTRNTTHRAGAPMNRSQVAQNAAHAAQHTERAHR